MRSCLPLIALLAAAAGCQQEPARACERVRFGWPLVQLDPSDDVAPDEEGIQLDFDLRSDLREGTLVALYLVAGEGDPAFVAQSLSGPDGVIPFRGVTVPLGEVIFFAQGQDSCGRFRTGRRVYVFDGLGIPRCDLQLAVPASDDPDSSLPVLGAEQDDDPNTPGMQLRLSIDAGRPDMSIDLFVSDRERGENQSYELDASEDGTATVVIPLGGGEQALRAVCHWEVEDLSPSSPTYEFWVDDSL
jgi:hypothetical protein